MNHVKKKRQRLLNRDLDEYRYFTDQWQDVMVNYEASSEALSILKRLPKTLLPFTPFEHIWLVQDGELQLKKHINAVEQDIKVVVYGPERGLINFLTLVNNRVCQSYANAQARSFDPERRTYPMLRRRDYVVPDFDYAALGRTRYHMAGHCIDHADTMDCGNLLSTFDRRNYIPEPPNSYWGKHIRNPWTQELRTRRSAYVQYPYYSLAPKQTVDGTFVPDGVFVSEVAELTLSKSYHVPFTFDQRLQPQLKGKAFLPLFATAIESTPSPVWLSSQMRVKTHKDLITSMARTQRCLGLNLSNPKHSHEVVKKFDHMLSEHECFHSHFKFRAALNAYKAQDFQRAQSSLQRALDHAEFLQNLEGNHTLIQKNQFKLLQKVFTTEPACFNDSQVDRLTKLVGDTKIGFGD